MKVAMALLSATLAAGLAITDAEAQQRPFTIGISGGPSFPVGEEFGEEAGTGFHVQGSVGASPSGLPVGVRADLLWQEFPDEHSGSFRQIGGLVNAVLGIAAGVARPYVLGGIGLMSLTAPEEEHGDHAHEGGTETAVAFALGGGFAFPFAGLSGTLEARFVAAGSEQRAVPVSIGIRF